MIGFARGGLTETVKPLGEATEPTGVFFSEQNAEAAAEAIERFERAADRFDPKAARRQAVLFRKERFEAELFDFLAAVLREPSGATRKAAA